MPPLIPLAIGGAAVLIAFIASGRDSGTKLGSAAKIDPKKLPKGSHPPTKASAPAGALHTTNNGDTQVVHADDAFDQAVASAIANHDINALGMLAYAAAAKGMNTVAHSIMDEIARLSPQNPPPPVPPKPDVTPIETPTPVLGLATYIIQAGDTGQKISQKYTGTVTRWPELVTVNPTLKAPAPLGFGPLYAGHRINLPASWPTGVPVLPPSPPPNAPPAIAAIPPAPPPGVGTYIIVSGDTGQKISQKFTGTVTRWPELVTVNPSLKAPAPLGFGPLYPGHKINIPASWPATPAQGASPAPSVYLPPPPPPPPVPMLPPPGADPLSLPPQSDARQAAQEITSYLQSIGGLAGRYKEDRSRVNAWQSRMGDPAPDGKYGPGSATRVIQNGLVPVAPYYWSRTNASTQKANFLSLVDSSAAADPQRADEWSKLRNDTVRS